MVKTIYAIDNEFAAASGGNVNFSPDWSYFDNPPNSTKNLTITSNADDDNPFLFETGETYDLAWTGHGGGSMEDAVVIRSDYLSPGEGALVFEGINSNTGELYQVVWSPEFDLETWFYDNGGPSNPPSFYTGDQDPMSYKVVCFAQDTQIATPDGPKLIQSLRTGDKVSTLDNGPQPILWIGRRNVPGIGSLAPITINAGRLQNTQDLIVSQNHRILIQSRVADIYYDTPEVWVPAKAMLKTFGIRATPKRQVHYYHLLLEHHEILTANGQLTESLLLGTETQKIMGAELEHAVTHDNCPANLFDRPMSSARPILKMHEAEFLVRTMSPAEYGEQLAAHLDKRSWKTF